MELALYEWNLAGGEMLYKTVETVYTHQFKFFFLLSSYRLHRRHRSRTAVRMQLVNVNGPLRGCPPRPVIRGMSCI
jgi:hypothetical protein